MKRREPSTRLPPNVRWIQNSDARPELKRSLAGDPSAQAQPPERRRSVCGRPRALTTSQIAAVLAWHDSRVTLKQLAVSMGVSTSTLTNAIQSRGTHYKQAPPEERAVALKAFRAHRRALRAANWM
jgi:predicted DNA-binding protein (UPF0251 family)